VSLAHIDEVRSDIDVMLLYLYVQYLISLVIQVTVL
jgi:hypothetical protein